MKNINRKNRQLLLLVCLFASFFLSACSVLSPPQSSDSPVLSWSGRQAQLQKIRHWQATGLLSVGQNKKTQTFSFQWQQDQDRYDIRLFAPLGLGSLRVLGDAEHAVLWKSFTRQITAKTPEKLMQAELGYTVPLASLFYWIRGLPDPHFPMTKTLDAKQHLLELQQQAWTIHFLAFKSIESTLELPTAMELDNNTLHVKLMITQWEIK